MRLLRHERKQSTVEPQPAAWVPGSPSESVIAAAVTEGQAKVTSVALTKREAVQIITETVDGQKYYQSVAQLACGRRRCKAIRHQRDEHALVTTLIHVNRWGESFSVNIDDTLLPPSVHGVVNQLATHTAELVDGAHRVMYARRFPNSDDDAVLEVAALTLNIEAIIFQRELATELAKLQSQEEDDVRILDFWDRVRKAQDAEG